MRCPLPQVAGECPATQVAGHSWGARWLGEVVSRLQVIQRYPELAGGGAGEGRCLLQCSKSRRAETFIAADPQVPHRDNHLIDCSYPDLLE